MIYESQTIGCSPSQVETVSSAPRKESAHGLCGRQKAHANRFSMQPQPFASPNRVLHSVSQIRSKAADAHGHRARSRFQPTRRDPPRCSCDGIRRGCGGAIFPQGAWRASSTSSIQCLTLVRFAPPRWVWHPMLAVAMSTGRPLSKASSLRSRRVVASSGWVIEYVPADPQHRCASGTSVRSNPSRVRMLSTAPPSFCACCNVHGQ